MPDIQTETVEDTAAALAAMEALSDLDDLDLGDDPVEEIIEEADEVEAISADAVLSDDDLSELDIKVERAEAYAGQTSTGVVADVTSAVTTPLGTTRKPRKTSTGATPATPRVSKDLNTLDPKVFALQVADVPDDAFKAKVIALIPKQVKIAEKFENLFVAIAGGKAPSTYTKAAFKLLDSKTTMTSADLIAHYKGMGLKEGTARSQTGQMMVLFDTLLIGKRSGQTLTLDPGSAIAAYLRGV